ncbi:MAG: ribose 5-phosphate isomerase B [Clostridia bacterium]|nr:ribose 5-phosphate isomerase B [Clostridia bacterium]MBQ8368568.1 ribose 5-phosphate isomerase B [Clostridia bacterium]
MEKRRIVIASDHAGYPLKQALIALLEAEGYPVADMGTNSTDSCDYPVYAEKACTYLTAGNADLCILCCGTGIGMSMAANKVRGIRAACCSDIFSTKFTRLHNNANVLCLGARVLGEGLAWELVQAFVTTEFEGGKHERRVNMIHDIEARN